MNVEFRNGCEFDYHTSGINKLRPEGILSSSLSSVEVVVVVENSYLEEMYGL
jgi:hypothetical protein